MILLFSPVNNINNLHDACRLFFFIRKMYIPCTTGYDGDMKKRNLIATTTILFTASVAPAQALTIENVTTESQLSSYSTGYIHDSWFDRFFTSPMANLMDWIEGDSHEPSMTGPVVTYVG